HARQGHLRATARPDFGGRWEIERRSAAPWHRVAWHRPNRGRPVGHMDPARCATACYPIERIELSMQAQDLYPYAGQGQGSWVRLPLDECEEYNYATTV